MKKRDNHYFAWGATAVLSVCAILMFYDLVFRSGTIAAYIGKFLDILAPIIYGAVMAYLFAPIVNWIENFLFRRAGKRRLGSLRAVSIAITWVLVLAVLVALLALLIPQFVSSVARLVENARTYYDRIYSWIMRLLEDNPEYAAYAESIFDQYYEGALSWVQTNLLPRAQDLLGYVTGGVVGVVTFFKNFFVGVIVSIYLLALKESFAAGGCKLLYALFSGERAAWLIRGVKKTDDIFSSFVRGKLLDSLIIGVLCYICSVILRFPYAPLISVVVGITNIIPFFGPFLGAIPSAFLILLDSPVKCLYFIIFIILLQQFDGNILGPKILGSSTGLSGFWVIVAILIGGGLWGVPGMFVGVPLFACVYTAARAFLAYRLKKKGLPADSGSYSAGGPVRSEEAGAPEEEP